MNESSKRKTEVWGAPVKMLALLAVAAGILAVHAIWPAATTGWLDPKSMAALVDLTSPGGIAEFVLISSFLIFAGVPRLLFFSAASMLVGFAGGFSLAMVASLIGSYASFRCLRWAGRGWLMKGSGDSTTLQKITGCEPTVISVFLIRQLPVSNLLINAGLAIGRVETRVFLLGSLLGFVPQGALASLIGSGARQGSTDGVARLGMAAVILATLWFVRSIWQKKQRQFAKEAV